MATYLVTCDKNGGNSERPSNALSGRCLQKDERLRLVRRIRRAVGNDARDVGRHWRQGG